MILFETGGLVALVLILFWVWALLDCISTDSALCRNLPKGVWLIIVLLLPDIGSLAWLLLGRVRLTPNTATPPKRTRQEAARGIVITN